MPPVARSQHPVGKSMTGGVLWKAVFDAAIRKGVSRAARRTRIGLPLRALCFKSLTSRSRRLASTCHGPYALWAARRGWHEADQAATAVGLCGLASTRLAGPPSGCALTVM
ncbi:hypothetical protein MAPG_00276 [Magnaporthiopsis poae ATCC 64411]|uniref:Uncharacterized protein n=1 Tax=Magnaporthiopsis poae (strain ATCC 64411 / 73-15) TaxID=644358 RepID=A0A0C4DKK1_MAGP6|nr:hypothetical protein MAPG_00276 [Magnaporthiopsis poae ATCC 64411]